MSPTSYQAAPPRVSAWEVTGHRSEVKARAFGVERREQHASAPPFGARIATAIARLRKTIQKFLRPAHHAEILARDALLQLRVMLELVVITTQRIDDARERVDRRHHALPVAALTQEVERAVLAALHGEHEHADDYHSPEHPPQRRSLRHHPRPAMSML